MEKVFCFFVGMRNIVVRMYSYDKIVIDSGKRKMIRVKIKFISFVMDMFV